MLLVAGPYHWPAGPEVLVNSYTPDRQTEPSIAMDGDGDYVIAWSSSDQNGFDYDVYAQRFNAAGAPQGPEFRVNTSTANTEWNASVAMDADGDFVIAWESAVIGAYVVYAADVYAQRYNAAGVPQGAEFRVSSSTTVNDLAPSVAAEADGDFVIAWESFYPDPPFYTGIYAQRYDAAGAAQGANVLVSTTLAGASAMVAMDGDGDYVVTWEFLADIYAQRFSALGIRQGGEFRVNSFTSDWQLEPHVAMDADGDFVVAWMSRVGSDYSYDVFARRFNAAGAAQGIEFRVNTYTTYTQQRACIAMDAAGDFVVSWQSYQQDGSKYGVYAQRYAAAGVAQGTEFRVNAHTTDNQVTPSAAMDADGDFVVTWNSRYQDGDEDGVYMQRYTMFGPASAATAGDRVWNDSNANGIQDAGEAGIAGATVELFSASGAGVTSVTTGAAGLYSIPMLAGTSAFLRFVTPAGMFITHANRGVDDELDSDGDRATGLTPVFSTGAAGTTNTSLDAGFSLPGSVGGVAFNDRSGDGVRNGGEEVLAGFDVFLDLDGDGVLDPGEPNGLTDAAGEYEFSNLFADTYRLGIVDQVQWLEPARSPFLIVPDATTPINLALRTSAPDSIDTAQGPEFRANSYTTNAQLAPAVATDADGDFIVVWQSMHQDGNQGGIYAQRYNAAGAPQGGEFRVNTTTSGHQSLPSVAMDDAGDFVVAWATDGPITGFDIFAQRYNAAGVKQGNEFRVNTITSVAQTEELAVAMDADGDFVVAWEDYGSIQVRRYNAAGVPFPVVYEYGFDKTAPSVAMDADGDFVVGWRRTTFNYPDPPDLILVRRYNAAGVPQGDGFVVGAGTAIGNEGPSLAMADDGDFIVSWVGYDADQTGIIARRYSAAGLPQGAEFLVNTYTTGIQSWPSAAMDASGGFIIAWTSTDQDGHGQGSYAQRFNAAGLRQGEEFRVNSQTTSNQHLPSSAMDADGDFVVSWQSYQQDGSNYGVYAQRYTVAQRPAITASQFVWQTAPQRIELTFDQDVSTSLSTADLVLRNETTGVTIPSSSIVMNWNAAMRTATFRFPTLPNGGSLPDGRYRATLAAAGVSNAAGTTIAVDYALDFFVLAGDANRDGRVNLQDFNILAANFGQSSSDFAHGDFNYDGQVNLRDFNILAGRFGASVSPPEGMPRAAADETTRASCPMN
jgi:hypothetical protein